MPVTPKIFTPLLILPATILLSIADVTADTLIGLYPSVPAGAAIVCDVVDGVTDNGLIIGLYYR